GRSARTFERERFLLGDVGPAFGEGWGRSRLSGIGLCRDGGLGYGRLRDLGTVPGRCGRLSGLDVVIPLAQTFVCLTGVFERRFEQLREGDSDAISEAAGRQPDDARSDDAAGDGG